MLATNDVVNQRYRLDAPIGEGGMGVVWRATDLTLERSVAVKVLFPPQEAEREEVHRRFLKEARLAAAVQHRNVVHITDFGTTGDGHAFMVMELLRGETLADHLERRGAMRPAEVIELGLRVLDGLAAVHRASVLHGDLKPENVFLVDDPDPPYPKILDFGVSRSMERSWDSSEEKSPIAGTPEYMAPEQFVARDSVGPSTDLFSLGVILFEALTLECPCENEDAAELVRAIVAGNRRRLEDVRPGVPRSLADAVERATALRPRDRFTDAVHMREALEAARLAPTAPLSVAIDRLHAGQGPFLLDEDPARDEVTDAELNLEIERVSARSADRSPAPTQVGQPRAFSGAVLGGVGLVAAAGVALVVFAQQPGAPRAPGRGVRPTATEPRSVPIQTASAAGPTEGGEDEAVSPGRDAVEAEARGPNVRGASTPEASSPDDEEIRILLTGLPDRAWVAVEGERHAPPDGRFSTELPERAGHRYTVDVGAPGHAPRRLALDGDEDHALHVDLVPAEEEAESEASSVAASETARADEAEAADSPSPAAPPATFRELDY